MKTSLKVVIALIIVAIVSGVLLVENLYHSNVKNEEYNYSSSSESSSSSYSYETNKHNSYESAPQKRAIRFYSVSDVMLYLNSRTFYCSSNGITVQIKSGGIYLNDTCCTGAVRVVEFDETQAIVTATSPFNGVQYSFLVDSEYGCIANNDETYYEQ